MFSSGGSFWPVGMALGRNGFPSQIADTGGPAVRHKPPHAGTRLCGIRTEQCVETTTRAGSDCGYRVICVAAAITTNPSGRLSADAVIERTEAVLRDRFARIVLVAEWPTGAAPGRGGAAECSPRRRARCCQCPHDAQIPDGSDANLPCRG